MRRSQSKANLARIFFSSISVGLTANALLFAATTSIEVRLFIVFLQVCILALSFLEE